MLLKFEFWKKEKGWTNAPIHVSQTPFMETA